MAILDGYDGLVVDLDGVVFRGDDVIRGAATHLRRRRSRPPTVFVTNNSSRTSHAWAELFASHRLEVEPAHVLTSATATARLLARDGPHPVLVLGEQGLRLALRDAGLELVDDPDVAATVVVGWDRGATWERLRDAARAIDRGARFVATNPDTRVPTPDGAVPGTGAALAFLRAATGAAPEVVGKPSTAMLEQAAALLDVDGPVLLVGDQAATDVAGARAMGWDAALVRSGVDDWPELVAAATLPTWVVDDLAGLDGPTPPRVRAADVADLPELEQLLVAADLDTAGLRDRLATTLVAEDVAGAVVGTASWELLGGAAHLRGITVASAERGLGTGRHLVATALHHLRGEQVAWAYLLTPQSDALFEGLGFWRVHRDRLPEQIVAQAQFGAATDGATALVRRLAT